MWGTFDIIREMLGHLYNLWENSLFVKHFLLALTKVSQPVTAMQLFDQSIKNGVELNSNQVPTYTQIQDVDSRGGEFIFVRTKNWMMIL